MKKRPDRILSMKYRLFNDGILIMINYNPRATGQYNHQYIKQTRFFKRVGYCMSQSSTINSTPTHFGVVPAVFFWPFKIILAALAVNEMDESWPNFTEQPWAPRNLWGVATSFLTVAFTVAIFFHQLLTTSFNLLDTWLGTTTKKRWWQVQPGSYQQ